MDAHVGNFILKECFVNYLKNKTRVLVTHKFESLKYVDYIYIFKKGRIVEEGTLESLKYSQIFHEIEEKYKIMAKNEEKKENDQEKISTKEGESKLKNSNADKTVEGKTPQKETPSEKAPTKIEADTEEDKKLKDKLMLDEDKETGQVEWRVWKSYFTYYGGWFYFFLIFLGKTFSLYLT